LLQFAAAKLRTLEHEQSLQVNLLLFNVIEAKEKDEDPAAKLLDRFLELEEHRSKPPSTTKTRGSKLPLRAA
jgi:hypothetical protein